MRPASWSVLSTCLSVCVLFACESVFCLMVQGVCCSKEGAGLGCLRRYWDGVQHVRSGNWVLGACAGSEHPRARAVYMAKQTTSDPALG